MLLSVRPAEAWAKSMTNTIWEVVYGDSLMHDLSSARIRVDPGWRDYMALITAMWEKSGLLPSSIGGPDQAELARAFEHYNEEVKSDSSSRALACLAARRWLGAAVRVP